MTSKYPMEQTKFNISTDTHRRLNMLTGEWVLVSPHRAKRPWQGKTEQTAKAATTTYDKECYLCPGNVRINGERSENYKDESTPKTDDFYKKTYFG